ncbi:MAG: terminase gpA endonuclease subunit [Pirellulaceae bacterium]
MNLATTDFGPAIHDELIWCIDRAKAQVVRPISKWVEDELVLPSGPFRGERYRHARHPASRLWFGAIDSGHWNRFAATGPTQNGKTLMCYVAPILYYLFEIQETVVIGLPTMQMANDKWSEDLLPAIEASRYAALLPKSGEGSRGGQVKRAIGFEHGVTLRFMTGGGTDKQRAGFTTRVVAITEVDGMDEPGETSREADKVEQIEGRTRAHGANKRIHLECTASIEKGRIWQEIVNGTDSRIARPCPHCKAYVTPEREHLIGWEDAESELEAAEKAFWSCPSCGEAWTEQQRFEAAEKAVLVHRGQKVLKNGRVVGQLPPTTTLGFRWSAIDNPFTKAAELGAEEWRARRHHDRENAEKKMLQFVWAMPWIPPEIELTSLTVEDVASRSGGLKKGKVPDDCIGIAGGIDTGMRELHWQMTAMRKNGSSHVIEYGVQPTNADSVGTEKGLFDALHALHGYFAAGWEDLAGRTWIPSQVWIDSGYASHQAAVYTFCKSAASGGSVGQEIYRPAKGYGEKQRYKTRYIAPKARGGLVRYIGLQFDMRMQPADGIVLVHVNSDFWKSALHERLAMSVDEPGALTLYETATAREHLEYSEQITAEVQKQEFIPGRGEVITWDRIRRNNHYLDAGYLSLAAGNFVFLEVERQAKQPTAGWMERQQKQRRSTWTGQ